jgi:pilus assembly protein CpaF
MATIHANSAKDAVSKLQTLPLLAGENISHKFIAPVVAAAIDLVIHLSIAPDGVRRIMEVAQVTGRIELDRVEVEMLYQFKALPKPGYERGLQDPMLIFSVPREGVNKEDA